MIWRLGPLGLLAITLSCGNTDLHPIGTGGSSGTGTAGTGDSGPGTAGTTGSGGSGGGGRGGSGGTLLACGGMGGAPAVVEVALKEADGMDVKTPTTAAVTVTSIESCAVVSCPSPTTEQATKIVLAGTAQQQWALYLRNTRMPSDTIKVGDAFDMTVDANVVGNFVVGVTTNQTIVLARNDNLVLFAATLSKSFGLDVPHLEPFGVAITDDGAVCDGGYLFGCFVRPHAARVAVDGATAVVPGGQVATIGWLSLTNGEFTAWMDSGSCDATSKTLMAGFRVGTTGPGGSGMGGGGT